MLRRAFTWLLLAAIPLLASAQGPLTSKFKRSADPVPERYIVVLNEELRSLGPVALESAARNLSDSQGGLLLRLYDTVLGGFAVRMSEQAAQKLSEDPRVRWVEEDGYVRGADIQANPPSWGLDRIDERTLPLDLAYFHLLSGTGVRVYVLDSGIRVTHQDIAGRAFAGFGAVDDGWGTDDCNGHGTHVAATIGGTAFGVAKGVTLSSVRVLNCSNQGTWIDFIEGVQWITANHIAPAVVNASISGAPNSSADLAVLQSIDAGLLYVMAAGNDALDACSFSPGRVGPALTVGATDVFDAVYAFSNQGTCVDIFAPGVNILSAGRANDTEQVARTGTSMAAPHVTGVAATYLSANPNAAPIDVVNAIVGNTTTNLITGLDQTTANRLLYSNFVSCLPGASVCAERCVDLQSDLMNCGACGVSCEYGCSGGQCSAPPPSCPPGKERCCPDNVCRYPAMCAKLGC
jgi:subtilisin family serine protease